MPNALFGDRAMRERYRTQFFAVYEKNFRTIDWPRRIMELAANSKTKLQPIDAEEAKRFDDRGKEASARVKGRLDAVRAQLEDSLQLRSIGGKASLAKYAWERNADEKEADERDLDARNCLHLTAGPKKGGDFRLPLSTGPGRYRLTAMVKASGIAAGKEEQGLRLRIESDLINRFHTCREQGINLGPRHGGGSGDPRLGGPACEISDNQILRLGQRIRRIQAGLPAIGQPIGAIPARLGDTLRKCQRQQCPGRSLGKIESHRPR